MTKKKLLWDAYIASASERQFHLYSELSDVQLQVVVIRLYPMKYADPGWTFYDGANTSFSILEDLWAVSCCTIPQGFNLPGILVCCWSWQTMPTAVESGTAFVLPEMCLVVSGSSTCSAVIMRQRVTQSMDYVFHNWVNMASIRFRSHLYFFVQRKTLWCAVSPRRSPWQAKKLKRGPGTWALAAWSVIWVGLKKEKGCRISANYSPGEFFFFKPAFQCVCVCVCVRGGGGNYSRAEAIQEKFFFQCRHSIST